MRQRPISSIPDSTLQTATACSFGRTLNRHYSRKLLLPEEIVPPTAGSLRPCRGPGQITDGFGVRGHSARLEIGAKHVRTAPTRGTMQPFSGFQSAGWAYPIIGDLL